MNSDGPVLGNLLRKVTTILRIKKPSRSVPGFKLTEILD